MRTFIYLAVAAPLLLAAACGGEERRPNPLGPSAPPALRLAVVSGNGQLGSAGEALAEPFVVRIADEQGTPVGHRAVVFEITSGDGAFGNCSPGPIGTAMADADGLARMVFVPTRAAESVIAARVGVAGDTVTFSARAETTIIRLSYDDYLGADEAPSFLGPCFMTGDVTVPRGTAVEWQGHSSVRQDLRYTVTSVSVPPGGQSFDSGVLEAGDRFRFTPHVSGTWEYRDALSGATGRLVVQ